MKNVIDTKNSEKSSVLSVNDFTESDYGAGFESVRQDNYAIPILRILQKGSPQCEKTDPRYIKGAEAGMIYNTVENEIYSAEEGVSIIPVYFDSVDIEYIPRTKGGGFVAVYGFDDKRPEIVGSDDKNRPLLANGNNLIKTAQHFILFNNGVAFVPCMMPMESTNLSISRNWLSFMRQLTIEVNGEYKMAPMYANIYRARTQIRHKDNNTWYVWKIDKEQSNKDFMNLARNYYKYFSKSVHKIIEDSETINNSIDSLNEEY